MESQQVDQKEKNEELEILREKYKSLSKKDKVNGKWGVAKIAEEIQKLENPAPTGENPDDGKTYGNIRQDVEIDPKDSGYVLFYVTDHGALKPGTVNDPVYSNNENWPPRKLVRMTPDNFWRCYASHFSDNGRFLSVMNAQTIIRLYLNLESKHVKSVIEFELSKAKDQPDRMRILENYNKYFSVLRLNGGNQVIHKQDIIHCPGISKVDVFPSECLPEEELV